MLTYHENSHSFETYILQIDLMKTLTTEC